MLGCQPCKAKDLLQHAHGIAQSLGADSIIVKDCPHLDDAGLAINQIQQQGVDRLGQGVETFPCLLEGLN